MAQQKKKDSNLVTAAKVAGAIAAGGAAGYFGGKYLRNRNIKKMVSKGMSGMTTTVSSTPKTPSTVSQVAKQLSKRQENSIKTGFKAKAFRSQAGNSRESIVAANKAKYGAIKQQRADSAIAEAAKQASAAKRASNTARVQQRRELLNKSGALTQIQTAKAASKQGKSLIKSADTTEKTRSNLNMMNASLKRLGSKGNYAGYVAQKREVRSSLKSLPSVGESSAKIQRASGLKTQSNAARQQAKQRINKIVASKGGYSGKVGGKQGTGNYSINIYTLYDF